LQNPPPPQRRGDFATTTPIPPDVDPAFSARAVAYNAAGREAMKEVGVEVLDLYAVAD
jgi:hypothetical protein